MTAFTSNPCYVGQMGVAQFEDGGTAACKVLAERSGLATHIECLSTGEAYARYLIDSHLFDASHRPWERLHLIDGYKVKGIQLLKRDLADAGQDLSVKVYSGICHRHKVETVKTK